MTNANCPNCGAPVRFQWSSAVQTTCEFCKSVLVRHDVNLERVGQVGDLPPDPSPIQIGTEGIFGNKAFTVAGRIIYDHPTGSWNEWHLVFNDGASGWLSDAQLEYAISEKTEPPGPLPPEDKMPVGQMFQWGGVIYQVAARTTAHYRGVLGELPFEYWDKSDCTFIDLRSATGAFATVDYSEDPPLLFTGRFVTFDELKLKNLREFEDWS